MLIFGAGTFNFGCTMEKNLILGIGEALWDCLPEGRKIGGAPANFAYHVGQFGWRNIVVSAVGNDALGDEYLEQLAGVKLEPMIARVPFPTGTVQVTISGEGIPSYEICENVAWDNIPWTDALEALAKETRAVCFGSLAQRSPVSRATVHRFLGSMSPDSERSLILICANHIITGRLSGRISNVQPSSSSMMRKSRWSRTYSIWTARRNLSAGN